MSSPAQPTEARIRTICLMVLAAIATAIALYLMRTIMVPLVLAVLLTYVLSPVVDLLVRRLRMPRGLAVAGALGIGTMLVAGIVRLVNSSVKKLAQNADAYEKRLHDLGDQASAWITELGIDLSDPAFEGSASDNVPISAWLSSAADAAVSTVSSTLLVLIFAIYMLQGTALRTGSSTGRSEGLGVEISSRIRRYLGLKVALSGVTGVLVWILLAMLGVDLALVFGVLAFVLNFIPSVGSIVATLLPIPIVLLDPDFSWSTLILAILLPGGVQMTVGNVLEPKLMGEQLELHPITVLAALTFWGILWGIPGMLLAVPITAALRIVLDAIEITRPVARLLAGKPLYDEPADAQTADAPPRADDPPAPAAAG